MDLDLDKVNLFIYQLSTISQILDLITVHLNIRLFHVPLGLISALSFQPLYSSTLRFPEHGRLKGLDCKWGRCVASLKWARVPADQRRSIYIYSQTNHPICLDFFAACFFSALFSVRCFLNMSFFFKTNYVAFYAQFVDSIFAHWTKRRIFP